MTLSIKSSQKTAYVFLSKKKRKKVSASGGRICGFDAELCIKRPKPKA